MVHPRSRHLHERWFGRAIAAPLSAAMFLAIPWQVALVVVTMVWLAVWIAVKRGFDLVAKEVPALRRGPARLYGWAANATLASPESAPYLATIVGLGIYVPALLGLSVWYQIRIAGVGSGGHVNWVAVFVYQALWLGPNHLFFAHVATLIHHLGHQRNAFKPWFRPIGNFIVGMLGVFYGHVPGNYPIGHVRIHHKFDNGPEDLTSTMALDRGSFSGWLRYRQQFILFWSGVSVVRYFLQRKRADAAWIQARGMLIFYGLIFAVTFWNWEIGFAYLILPHIIIINFISAINFTWHMFIDPKDPGNVYTNSICILEAQQDVWNEAHHISHHALPQAPWSRMPDHFRDKRDEYMANRANIFRDTQVFEIFVLCLAGRVDKLAERFVDLGGTLSREEVIALLRERLRPVPPVPASHGDAAVELAA